MFRGLEELIVNLRAPELTTWRMMTRRAPRQ